MFSKFTFLPCQILAVAWLVSLEKMQKSGIFLLALSSPHVGVQVTITTTSNGSNTKSPEKWPTLHSQKSLCAFYFFCLRSYSSQNYLLKDAKKKTHLNSVFCWCHHQQNILKKYQLQISMSTIFHCLGKFRTARLQSEAPHWQAPQIWPIASPNDKPGLLSGGSWWFNHCQGSNLLDPLRCLWCYVWNKRVLYLTCSRCKKKICQNSGPSTAHERFLVWCFNKARVFYPPENQQPNLTQKKTAASPTRQSNWQ